MSEPAPIQIRKNYANIAEGAEKKSGRKRVRYSIFFLTWNSNHVVDDINDPKFQELESAAEIYWANFTTNICQYINILDGEPDEIKSITVDPAFEIGGELRRFHAHLYIRVDHYTKVRLALDKIRHELPSAMPTGAGYINVLSSNNSTRTLQDYIHKNKAGTFPTK